MTDGIISNDNKVGNACIVQDGINIEEGTRQMGNLMSRLSSGYCTPVPVPATVEFEG